MNNTDRQAERRKFWIDVFVARAQNDGMVIPPLFADTALKDFDERFPISTCGRIQKFAGGKDFGPCILELGHFGNCKDASGGELIDHAGEFCEKICRNLQRNIGRTNMCPTKIP